MRTSASGLHLTMVCSGPAVLGRVGRVLPQSDRGTAIHTFMENVPRLSREDALVLAPEEYREECERIDVSPVWGLHRLGEAHIECALAWNWRTDTTRHLGDSLGRDYSTTSEDEIPGTADVLVYASGRCVVADWKTGSSEIPPTRENWQMRFLSVAAARLHGVSEVEARLYKLREDGTWYCDSATFDALELDAFAEEMQRRMERLSMASESYSTTGNLPGLVTGEHCRYCAAISQCPAQTALARIAIQQSSEVIVDGEVSVERVRQRVSELTPSQAGEAFVQLQQIEAFAGALRDALVARVKAEPLPLPNGKTLREVIETREYVAGEKARRFFEERYGKEVASRVCKVTTSSSKEAIRREFGKASKGVIEELEKAGGIIAKPSTRIKAV